MGTCWCFLWSLWYPATECLTERDTDRNWIMPITARVTRLSHMCQHPKYKTLSLIKCQWKKLWENLLFSKKNAEECTSCSLQNSDLNIHKGEWLLFTKNNVYYIAEVIFLCYTRNQRCVWPVEKPFTRWHATECDHVWIYDQGLSIGRKLKLQRVSSHTHVTASGP